MCIDTDVVSKICYAELWFDEVELRSMDRLCSMWIEGKLWYADGIWWINEGLNWFLLVFVDFLEDVLEEVFEEILN